MMRCGWTEAEIKKELQGRLKECETQEQKELILSIAKEANDRGNSWPLCPKEVPMPKLYLEEKR
jgi:hypothetical protein